MGSKFENPLDTSTKMTWFRDVAPTICAGGAARVLMACGGALAESVDGCHGATQGVP